MLSNKTLTLILNSFPFLLKGALVTIQIAVFATIIGLFFGCMFGVFSSKKLRVKGLAQIIDLYLAIFQDLRLLAHHFHLPNHQTL